jgi:ribonuclease HI
MKKKKRETPSELLSAPLTHVLHHLGVEAWDYVIVSDGSGTGWKMGCGWASTLISRRPRTRKVFTGGMNPGTVSLGEMFAIYHPLIYLASKLDIDKQLKRVHVISDSEYVVRTGNGHQRPTKHSALWRMLSALRAEGLLVTFHWLPRDSTELNRLADLLAGSARKSIQSVDVDQAVTQLGFSDLKKMNSERPGC